MKKKIIILGIAGLLTCEISEAQSTQAIEVAEKISQKMKDSLDLNEEQRKNVYALNIRLHSRKMEVRQKFAETDSLSRYFQRIENTRDSLYREILPEEKYLLYRQKKKNLVNND
jgi:hypothetical protein